MSRRLEGKRALVTGGSRGIGRGIALAYAEAGAGVATRFQPVHEVDPGYWERVIGIDLTGVFHTLHAALPILRAQGSGVILTISSIEADACRANGGPYTASKAAVTALTKVVARENASANIRCNVISPGLVMTDMGQGLLEQHGEAVISGIPLGRAGTPEDVARLAVYLASDDAAWITATNFRIDGGQW